jgi:hypothetical protein
MAPFELRISPDLDHPFRSEPIINFVEADHLCRLKPITA